jgi:hypothetical protein
MPTEIIVQTKPPTYDKSDGKYYTAERAMKFAPDGRLVDIGPEVRREWKLEECDS